MRRLVLCGLLAIGCINEDRRLYEVELAGEVVADTTLSGVVHLELHHAETGAGPLRTPLGRIDETEVAGLGEASWTTLVPIDEGEGLVLYGWLDVDGDGVLCAPGATPEPAGVVEISDFPAHTLAFTLTLDTPCAGASALFPG